MRKVHIAGPAVVILIAVLGGCGFNDPEVEETPSISETSPWIELGNVEDPPGSEPEPYGSGWFQGGFHSAPVFAPDGKTVWWAGSYSSAKIYVSRFENGNWTGQEMVSFSAAILSYRDPFISPDGMKFFFISTEPVPGQSGSRKENLWIMEWVDTGWTEPQPLPEVINSYKLHWTTSVASNNDLYFSANIDGNPEIFKSIYQDGIYTEPIALGYPVNTEELEFTPNIAPDQSYLLFSRTKDNESPPRLYITYALEDGWSDPIRIENVENCISPIVTPDRQYVIYLNGSATLEWRDTSFIEELRPE